MPYEKIRGRGIRFRYTEIEGDSIGHAWFFKPRDLRGKILRVRYSGIVPCEMVFKIARSSESAAVSSRVRLESSSETKTFALRIPAAFPFREVSVFKFEIEKETAGRPYGDFLIEKVEILKPWEARL